VGHLRIIRTDPDTPGYMLDETAAHTECLTQLLRPGLTLTFPRHWAGKGPMPNDDADIFPAHPEEARSAVSKGPMCAFCAEPIAPADLVRLRVQKPVGPVKKPEFDEQSLPVHFECLARVAIMIIAASTRHRICALHR
jgi:hypothetical protein